MSPTRHPRHSRDNEDTAVPQLHNRLSDITTESGREFARLQLQVISDNRWRIEAVERRVEARAELERRYAERIAETDAIIEDYRTRMAALEKEVARIRAISDSLHGGMFSGGTSKRPVFRVIRGGHAEAEMGGPTIVAFDSARFREHIDKLQRLLWLPRMRVAWGAASLAIAVLIGLQIGSGGPATPRHVASGPATHMIVLPDDDTIVNTTRYIPRTEANHHLTVLLRRWTEMRTWLRVHRVAAPPALLALPAHIWSVPVTYLRVVSSGADQEHNDRHHSPAPMPSLTTIQPPVAPSLTTAPPTSPATTPPTPSSTATP